MCCTRLSRFFRRLNILPVSCFQNLLHPGCDDGSSSHKSGWNVSKVYYQQIAESTEVEMYLSSKFSKKNFGRILRPKPVRRPLVTGLSYGPRANKQFDMAYWVFWALPGSSGHSDSLIFKTWLLTVSKFESQLMQTPAPGSSSFIGPAPGHLLLCKSPGAGHTFPYKSPGVPRGMVTGQNDSLH